MEIAQSVWGGTVTEMVRELLVASSPIAAIVASDEASPPTLEADCHLNCSHAANMLARQSGAEYIALVESDLLEDMGTLAQMVDWLESDRQLAAVVAVPLSVCATRKMTLMPNVRTTMIRREALLRADGFDEAYCGWGETLDLGWRWWIMGYSVGQMPANVKPLIARDRVTFTLDESYTLPWQNWLWTMIKNREDGHLSSEVSMALLELLAKTYRDAESDIVERPVEILRRQSRWQKLIRRLKRTDDALRLYISPDDPTVPLVSGPRHMVTALVAANDIIEAMPLLMKIRQEIQARRQRSDAEIERLLGVDLPTLVESSFLKSGGI